MIKDPRHKTEDRRMQKRRFSDRWPMQRWVLAVFALSVALQALNNQRMAAVMLLAGLIVWLFDLWQIRRDKRR